MSLDYYNSIKNNEHIFLYSVCGRTSSTALQRFINSSNEVCMWGEPWGLMNKMLDTIRYLENFHSDSGWHRLREEHSHMLELSFKQNQHDAFYPNSFRKMDDMAEAIRGGIAKTLAPHNDAKRFGFKEIMCDHPGIIEVLTSTFPKSKVIFLFRNPCKQWPSVKNANYWDYSENLSMFLESYNKYAKNLLDAYQKANNKKQIRFVEDSELYNLEMCKNLMAYLNISSFDESLVGNIIKSTSGDLSPEDKKKILFSPAHEAYEQLRLACKSQNK